MPSPSPADPPSPPRLLDQVVAKMQLMHYSKRTEGAYVDWMKRLLIFRIRAMAARWLGPADARTFQSPYKRSVV